MAYRVKEIASADPAGLRDLINESGLVGKMRAIARLERKGLEPVQVAMELSKSGEDWRLEEVLCYMGIYSEQDAEERRTTREKYERVRAEIDAASILGDKETDIQIREMRAQALTVMQNALVSAQLPRDQMQIAKEVLALSEVGGSKKIVHEYRADPDLLEALRSLTEWKKPEPLLPKLMEEDGFVVPDGSAKRAN